MSFQNELSYTNDISDIVSVQFGILSPEEIKKRSVVHCVSHDLYDSNNEPIIGGLFDPRMGVLDRGKIAGMYNKQDISMEELIESLYEVARTGKI